MHDAYSHMVVITRESIYGKDHIIPAGYRVVDFRPPRSGERFASIHATVAAEASLNWDVENPRLILARFEPRRIVFETTGEIRTPKKGEWYASTNFQCLAQAAYDYDNSRHEILKKVE